MSPDELHELRIARLEQDIRDERAARAEAVEKLDARVEKSDDRVRLLIMVLVGFAFTVAASAVTLALSLGGPS